MHSQSPLVPLLLLPAIVAWTIFLFWIISQTSGWARMAKRFKAAERPSDGKVFRSQSGKFGWCAYNNCLTIQISSKGLYLALPRLFSAWHPPLLIPWSAICNPRQKNFLWVHLVEFDVGEPRLAKVRLPRKVFAEFASSGGG